MKTGYFYDANGNPLCNTNYIRYIINDDGLPLQKILDSLEYTSDIERVPDATKLPTQGTENHLYIATTTGAFYLWSNEVQGYIRINGVDGGIIENSHMHENMTVLNDIKYALTEELKTHYDGAIQTIYIGDEVQPKEGDIIRIPPVSGAASTVMKTNLSPDKVLVSDPDGKISSSAITKEELSTLSGINTNIQNQINNAEEQIVIENQRATEKENSLEIALNQENNRALNVENDLRESINQENIRASSAENEIRSSVTNETNRAKDSESSIINNLNLEIERATDEETKLNTALTSHVSDSSNPHKVTKAQIGLGNVTNESKTVMFTSPVFTGVPTAPSASPDTSSSQLATTQFVQEAIGRGIAASDALIFKGTLGDGGTLTKLPSTYRTGWTYRIISKGTFAGEVCEPGDLITALVSRSGTGNVDSDWTVSQTNIDGAVVSTRKLNAGNGLTGGGDLSYDRTFNVGAGNGISVTADAVAVKPNATGTAGTIGKIVVDANGVGVVLGNTSSTSFRGDQGKTAYDHSQSTHARTDATKTEASTTNGNIKINGAETPVYVHPSGTNPHGTTKADVGLGNVPNVATNNQTVTYSQATSITALASGEKLSVAFGKISKAVSDLISHIGDAVKHITADERTKWNAVTNKVDKVSGKQLSTNDYSTTEKNKLAGIAAGAEVNVQPDWTITDTGSDAYIKNKPTSMPANGGNSDTTIKFKTARTINGVSFDGTKNISIEANTPINVLTTGSLNDVKTFGDYYAGGANSVTNKPTGVDSFGLRVFRVAIGYIGQELETNSRKWLRTCNNSANTWSSWVEFYSENHKPTWNEVTGKPSTFVPSSHTHTKNQISDMPTKLSQFTNDPGFITSADIDTSQNHTHSNKAVLDKVTQTLLDNWNAAATNSKKVTQNTTTTSAEYRVLLSNSADDTNKTDATLKSTKLRFNPSSGELNATKYTVNNKVTLEYDSTSECLNFKFL